MQTHAIQSIADHVTFTPVVTVTANAVEIFIVIETDAVITRRRFYRVALP